MEWIIPEILAEGRHLSAALLLLGFAVGLILWLAGWWSYRFWGALFLTVLAGVFGLYHAERFSLEPLVSALLFAVAAGTLALSLLRLVLFAVAGVAFIALIRVIAPGVHAPWPCLLCGGVLSIILFRLWIMGLTSYLGALLMGYTSLCLLDRISVFNCVVWSRENWMWLNGFCGFSTFLGTVLQLFLHRWAAKKRSGEDKKDDDDSDTPNLLDRLRIPLPFRKAA